MRSKLISVAQQTGCLVRETTRPANPTQYGGKEGLTAASGSPFGEYSPRQKPPKSTHVRPRPGEGTTSEKHEFYDRNFTFPGRGPRRGPHVSPS